MHWIYTLLLSSIFISNIVSAEASSRILPFDQAVHDTRNYQSNPKSLKITVTTKAPFFTEKNDGFLDLLLLEIGSRLALEFEVLKNIPPARALFKLSQGTIDGDFPRVAGLEKIYPSISYVPEKIIDFEFVAFSNEKCPNPISFASMQESKVGFIIGWKIYEQKTKNFSKLTMIVNPPQLYKLLDRKRIQYALHEHHIGNKFITDLGLEKVIYECSPPLMIKPMYLYLNDKHQALIPLISQALKDIKADGTYQQIAAATLH